MSEAECEFQGPEFLFQQGPTLYADVGFDPGYRPGSTHRPNLQNNNIPALVDTGAFASCVDSKIAQVLNLPQIDHTVRVSGARGSHEHNMHLGQIYIPALDFTLWGRLIAVDLLAGDNHTGCCSAEISSNGFGWNTKEERAASSLQTAQSDQASHSCEQSPCQPSHFWLRNSN